MRHFPVSPPRDRSDGGVRDLLGSSPRAVASDDEVRVAASRSCSVSYSTGSFFTNKRPTDAGVALIAQRSADMGRYPFDTSCLEGGQLLPIDGSRRYVDSQREGGMCADSQFDDVELDDANSGMADGDGAGY